MAYKWTTFKDQQVREMFKDGIPRRHIADRLGIPRRDLDRRMATMRFTRDPLSIEKFAQIEADFHARKAQGFISRNSAGI